MECVLHSNIDYAIFLKANWTGWIHRRIVNWVHRLNDFKIHCWLDFKVKIKLLKTRSVKKKQKPLPKIQNLWAVMWQKEKKILINEV